MGRGLGVITLTPTVQIAAGVVYIDRVQIKLLPAGGIIWTPNPDARYEILFPNPKLARRWTTIGNTDVWLYATGEYGGGSWTIQRIGFTDQADYNDIRVGGGIEGVRLSRHARLLRKRLRLRSQDHLPQRHAQLQSVRHHRAAGGLVVLTGHTGNARRVYLDHATCRDLSWVSPAA